MKKRFKLQKGQSKKMFSRHADHTHKRNLPSLPPRGVPMRGGIRL